MAFLRRVSILFVVIPDKPAQRARSGIHVGLASKNKWIDSRHPWRLHGGPASPLALAVLQTQWDSARKQRVRPRNDGGRGYPLVVSRGVALTSAFAAIALLAGCSGKPAAQQSSTTPHNVTLTKEQQGSIRVYTVEPAQYRTAITTTGVVDFDHNRATDILAPFSGAVTRVLVTQGQHVAKGQALAEVASPDFTAAAGAYRKAVLAANAADAVAANDRDLYAHQAISQRENAQAQADAASADADRAAALQTLVALHMDAKTIADIRAGKPAAHGQGVILAPIAGTLVAKSIAPGQTLAAGTTPSFTIADTSRMWVMANVFGDDIARVQTGDPATVVTGDGGKPMTGTVTNVGAVIDPDTRSVNARVAVDKPDGVLKKQMYVTVRIQSHAAHTGLLIPVSAVLRDDENLPFVYVVDADGSYARRPVTLGSRVDDRYLIPEGLHAGDKVVMDGSIFLQFIQSQ
ncbi:MAG: efflux RND transporter periplasmic adaptor subunit [Rhodanobacteraceae bacterium]|nr:MAG: efflux RND transporter periplasmic adaptor subunit [Rhodanobacteraceae bacterium]